MCEDKVAELFIKKILGNSRELLKNIDFITDVHDAKGTSYTNYLALIKNAPKLLSDSIIVLDPDVDYKPINKLHYKYVKKLPDPDNVPIEKRIAKYVYDLPGDDDLFKEKERMARQSDMLDQHIIFNEFTTSKNIKPYKDWAKSDKSFFRKALSRYVKDNNNFFTIFKAQLLDLINERRAQNGLPEI